MTGSAHKSLVVALGQSAGAPRAAVDAVQLHGLHSLIHGAPATSTEISRASEIPLTEIQNGIEGLLSVGRIEVDDDLVLGVGGLTLSPRITS